MSFYNKIAEKYEDRYKDDDFLYVENFLTQFKEKDKVLEIGCGTFHWSKTFSKRAFGIDVSIGMLKAAKGKGFLINAKAERLPVKKESFDFVYIVNALHQFEEKEPALSEIFRVLKPNGTFALITPDFHNEEFQWYIYEFFSGASEIDLRRFLPVEEIQNILHAAGFKIKYAEEIHRTEIKFIGEEVWNDKFLAKHNSSQLARLTQEEYEEVLERIRSAIRQNPQRRFEVVIPVYGIIADKV